MYVCVRVFVCIYKYVQIYVNFKKLVIVYAVCVCMCVCVCVYSSNYVISTIPDPAGIRRNFSIQVQVFLRRCSVMIFCLCLSYMLEDTSTSLILYKICKN